MNNLKSPRDERPTQRTRDAISARRVLSRQRLVKGLNDKLTRVRPKIAVSALYSCVM
jgi:hypothetical protein